jgi:hypothetical protein
VSMNEAAGGELVAVVVAVLVVEEVRAIGGDVVGPAALLQDAGALPAAHVDGVHVLEIAPVQAPLQLVGRDVPPHRPGAPGRRRHVLHQVVGEAHELLGRRPVDGQVAERAVAAGLDLLLALQPGVLPVPDHQLGLLVGGDRVGSRPRRGPGLGAFPGRNRVAGGGLLGLLLPGLAHLHLVDPEEEGVQGVGPLRGPVGRYRHPLGEALVQGGIEDHLGRSGASREAGPAQHRVEGVLPIVVVHRFERHQGRLPSRPGQLGVAGLVALQHPHHPALHVTQLDAVARLAGGVHHPGQPAARVVEGEVGHVAQVQLRAGRQLVEDEVGAPGAVIRAARRGGSPRGRCSRYSRGRRPARRT